MNNMINDRFTGNIKTVSTGTLGDTSYATLSKNHPFEKDKEVALRVYTEIGLEDVYDILGEITKEELAPIGTAAEYEKIKGVLPQLPRPDRGTVTYKEYTDEYSNLIENKLKEMGELD